MHPSGPDVVAAGRNEVGYTFHFLDGHTDRVWATCRGKESPTSVGHCFMCHTFFGREGYKTIEDATAAHICNPKLGEQRAKRGPHPTHLPTPAGGAGTTSAMVEGPVVMITRKYLRDKYEEHGKTLEYPYDNDCAIDVIPSIDLVFQQAFRAPGLLEKNKELSAEITALRTSTPTTSGTLDVGLLLTMLKMNSKFTKFVSEVEALKIQASKREVIDDDEVLPYNPFQVIEQFVHDAKKLKTIEACHKAKCDAQGEQIKTLEGTIANASQQIEGYLRDIRSYQKDVSSLNEELRRQEAEIKRLRALTENVVIPPVLEMRPAPAETSQPVVEAPDAVSQELQAPQLQVE